MADKNKTGFSLIELMVVVAIIGILATVGVPAYNNYITKARLAELVSAPSGLKAEAAEVIAFNNAIGTNCTAVASGTTLGPNTTYEVTTACLIHVTGTGNIAGYSVTFTPTYDSTSGIVSWACSDNSSTNPVINLPRACQ